MQQLDLFSRFMQSIKLDTTLTAPRLWIRCLVIWRARDEEIRRITFRRGLNIVWTPDASARNAASPPDAVGHGAGKTLLCELIRYCLGEKSPTDRQTRAALAQKWPDGAVGAEIELDGQRWGVLRSIGMSRQHVAVSGAPPAFNLNELNGAIPFDKWLMELERQLIPPDLHSLFPEYRDNVPHSWHFALAWMTRDQACRLRHPVSWRSSESGVGSPVRHRSIKRLDRVGAMAILLGVSDEAERENQQKIKELEQKVRTLGRRIKQKEEDSNAASRRMASILKIDPSTLPKGPLSLETLAQKLDSEGAPSPVRALTPEEEALNRVQEQLWDMARQAGHLAAQLKEIPGRRKLLNDELVRTEEDKPPIFEELKHTYPTCRYCEVALDDVLVTGCKYSTDEADFHQLKARYDRCQRRVDEIHDELQQLIQRESELRLDLRTVEKEASQHNEAARELKSRIHTEQERAIERATIRGRIASLRDAFDEVSALEDRLRGRTAELERAKDARDRMRALQSRQLEALNTRYDQTVRSLLGSAASGHLRLGARGVQLTVAPGQERASEGFKSLRVLALDIAALWLAAEGRAHLPGILIHDSPREADLGRSIYHRIFELMTTVEASCGENVPFQYIITTTTAPPLDMQTDPWVICRLSGSIPEEKLLRCEV